MELGRLTRREWQALALCAVLAALFMHDWDGFVFERTVRDLYDGVTPYETADEAPWYSLLGPGDHAPQWYAYPPLPLLAMALSFLPAIFLDVPEPAQRLLLKLPMIVAHIALARVVAAWARHAGGDEAKAHRWTLWNPFLILVGPVWGMTDGLLMTLLLAGTLLFVRGRPGWAGVLIGGSLLVKPFPALLAIPVLAWAWTRRPHRHLAGATLAAGATFAVVSLPFALGSPTGFLRQVGGAHLARSAQGLTFWRWPGLDALTPATVQWASMALLALLLAMASLWAARRGRPEGPIEAMLAGALAVLLANRVVNEQYVVMAVAPLAILASLSPSWRRVHHVLTGILCAAVILTGFHFLTFIPPDIALPLFDRPVDEVAHQMRVAMPYFWSWLSESFLYVVPVALAWVAWHLQPVRLAPLRMATLRMAAPSLVLCLLLAGTGLATIPDAAPEAPRFEAAYDETAVSAFYYLWWNNPAHDPDVRYGNWLKVSQDPAVGYYTNNRGIAALHARQMVDGGIDTAIVSYHRGEEDRYAVFQEEAAGQGLWVAPLIELNQVYDKVHDGRRVHRPINETGAEAPYAAYRLSDGAQDEIVHFVLDLKAGLAMDNALRIDGRPVVLFYDAYVSGISFDGEDRDRLAQAALELFGVDRLREHYGDPTLEDDYRDLLRYHPTTYAEFFGGPRAAPWRAAHLHVHQEFWRELQERVEAETGPLFWISGDAYNDRAGFEAGIVQSLNNLDLFDGSFIYSPSFTWGTNPGRPFDDVFAAWEDRNHWMESFGNGRGKFTAVGLAPAYDDTVNRPTIGFVIPDRVDNISTYERSWESVLATRPSWVALATWNEYFEGSSIEPDTVHGDEWLSATPGYRERFVSPPTSNRTVAFAVSEWQSRLHFSGGERAEPHQWGMDLVAAGVRSFGNATPYAFDIQDESGAAIPKPAAVLIDGARAEHEVSRFIEDRLAAWVAEGVPVIIFGPGASQDLEAFVAPPCRALDEVGTPTLLPGDRLWRNGEGLWLDRVVQNATVGTDPATGKARTWNDLATFRVGRSDCGAGASYASMKPTGTGSSVTDAPCVAVAVAFFLLDQAGPTECRVAAPAFSSPSSVHNA